MVSKGAGGKFGCGFLSAVKNVEAALQRSPYCWLVAAVDSQIGELFVGWISSRDSGTKEFEVSASLPLLSTALEEGIWSWTACELMIILVCCSSALEEGLLSSRVCALLGVWTIVGRAPRTRTKAFVRFEEW